MYSTSRLVQEAGGLCGRSIVQNLCQKHASVRPGTSQSPAFLPSGRGRSGSIWPMAAIHRAIFCQISKRRLVSASSHNLFRNETTRRRAGGNTGWEVTALKPKSGCPRPRLSSLAECHDILLHAKQAHPPALACTGVCPPQGSFIAAVASISKIKQAEGIAGKAAAWFQGQCLACFL